MQLPVKIGVLLLLLLSSTSFAFTQQSTYSDRCTIVVSDVTGVKSKSQKPAELGSFDTTISEEQLTTKSFRLPKTRLYVVASVFYTDESMAGDNSQDSMSLELLISPTPKRRILSGLQFAEAEVLTKDFQVARVSTIYKTKQRSLFLIMECRSQKPNKED